MNTPSLKDLLNQAAEICGVERVEGILKELINSNQKKSDVLTIIANDALHKIPPQYFHGELYVASKGNLNFNSKEMVMSELQSILLTVKEKLSEKSWKKVYLIPTGHPILALQIKNLVYHILRLDTADLFYSAGQYYEIEICRADFLRER